MIFIFLEYGLIKLNS